MIKYLIGILLSISSLFAVTPEGTYENVYFLNANLQSITQYSSARYLEPAEQSFILGENFDKNSMSYIRPSNYKWSKHEKEDMLVFPNTPAYGWLIEKGRDDFYIEKLGTNQHRLLFNGNLLTGDAILEENIVSAVIPKNFRIKTYEAFKYTNENGDMERIKGANVKQKGNTITLYAKNVKGASLVLVIEEKSSTSSIYKNVSQSMSKYKEIKVTTKDNETKIIMPMDNVFDSGSALTKEKGKLWLADLSKSLAGKKVKEIRVEGHTDNTPIQTVQFPSNWELSSARASDAVKEMIKNKVPQNKVVVMGYGDTRPIVKNDTPENKAKNRRIEITIIGSY